jgi:hypothetical protein
VAQTGEPYAYTGDDPVNDVDPNGLKSNETFTCLRSFNGSGIGLMSASDSVWCNSGPIVGGTLRSGSSAAEARAAAEASGYEIPPNYVAEPANNGQGWVFRAPGTSGNASIIRVAEANSRNPTGYVRYYNSYGQPLTAEGKPGPDSDTHLPLRPDDPAEPGNEDPFGDLIPELDFTTGCGEVIYAWV